tara:strand:+ start:347 stop:1597 length:1251 start_codon:yes stop_codon:yes gene_type:complete
MAFIFKITTVFNGQSFVIPCINVGTFNATVDYGDGTGSQTVTAYNDANLTHSFATAGQHTITIDGTFPNVNFFNNGASRDRVDEVVDLGDVGWLNLFRAFRNCTNLTDFNVGTADTSNVTTTAEMFHTCNALTTLDLSNLDTSSVTNMYQMFINCSSLTSLDLSNFDNSIVTNMSMMFFSCPSLATLNVSNFNTPSVTNMSYMFYACSSLTSLDASSFNTSSVNNMTLMLYNCSALTNLNIKHFNISSVTNGSNFLLNSNNALTTTQYDELLKAWAAQDVQPNVSWHFGDAQYSVESITGWTANAGGKLSVIGNKLALINGSSSAANTTTPATLEVGKSYTLTFDFIKSSTDAFIAFNSAAAGGSGTRLTSLNLTSTGSYSVVYTSTLTNAYVEFANNNTTINHSSKVYNMSLKLT